MKPHDLRAVKDVELAVIRRIAPDLGDEAQVRELLVKGLWQADVEVRGEHCPDQAPQHELRQMPVPRANRLSRPHQVEKDLLPVGSRFEQMPDNQREVLR
jgi:hypothetical protein